MQACPVCSLSGAGLPHPVAGILGWRRRIPQDQHRCLSDRRARPTPSRALLTARWRPHSSPLNPGLRRLPAADRVASYTTWPSSGFPGSSDACGPDRRSRTAPTRPRLGPSRKSWCAHKLPVAGLAPRRHRRCLLAPTGQGSIQCTHCATWSPARVRSSRPASPGRSPQLPDSLAVHPLAARGARRIRRRLQRLVVVFTRMATVETGGAKEVERHHVVLVDRWEGTTTALAGGRLGGRRQGAGCGLRRVVRC